jgi:hypothetical protein
MWHGGRGLLLWRWAAGSWHCAARPCHKGALLPPYPRRQGLNVVRHGGSRCGVWLQMYISRKKNFVHLFFENQRKKYKKIQESRSPFWRDGLLMRMLCFFYVLIVFFGLLNNIK